MLVIETQNLCKSYGTHRVLHDVNLQIESGKLVGFLGPNGAGKTTTIRILLGLLSANSGSASLLGLGCHTHGKRIRRDVGYLPGDVHLYSNLTGRQTLQFIARVRRQNCDSEIERLARRFELELNKKVRKYSTGMRQKLGLIQALMHRPKLLILDEPTSSLDPLVKTTVFEELRQVTNDGRSVLFSSHSLNEVEELCDEVIILRNGKIVEHQRIETLRQKALRRVEIRFATHQSVPADFPAGFQLVERNGTTVHATWSGEIEVLIEWVSNVRTDDLIIERPDLNDLFFTYYSDTK